MGVYLVSLIGGLPLLPLHMGSLFSFDEPLRFHALASVRAIAPVPASLPSLSSCALDFPGLPWKGNSS